MLFPARGIPFPSDRHRGLEGTKRNMREQKGKTGRLRRADEHPASKHEVANPTALQGPSGHCDPPSTTKRTFGQDVRRPGITADPKSAKSSGSGPSPSAPSTEEPVDPSALNSTIECAQMTLAETSGVREGSITGHEGLMSVPAGLLAIAGPLERLGPTDGRRP